LFDETGILDTNTDIPWEYVRKPFWWKIRNNYIKEITNILNTHEYDERHFNDFLSEKGVNTMEDNIMSIKIKYILFNEFLVKTNHDDHTILHQLMK